MTTKEAVELAKLGKEEGFTALYNEFYKSKFYLALQYTKNETMAEDVLQDAFVTAFKRLEDLDNPEAFGSWFGTIVTRTALNALKKNHNVTLSFFETSEDEGEEYELQIPDQNITSQPELSYTRKETQELVRSMVDALSDEQRFCIMMFYLENMSIKEIANSLDCSENTVKSRLNYGRKNLEKQGEELKKKGYQLYSIAPVTLLVLLLREEASAYAATAAGQAGAAAAMKAAAASKAATVSKAATAVKGATKTTFLATAQGKVVAVAIAAVLAGGAAGGGYSLAQKIKEVDKGTEDHRQDTNTSNANTQDNNQKENQTNIVIPETRLPDWKTPYRELLSTYGQSDRYTLVDIDENGIPELYVLKDGHIERYGYLKQEDESYKVTELTGSLIDFMEANENIRVTLYTDEYRSLVFQLIQYTDRNTEKAIFDKSLDGNVIAGMEDEEVNPEENAYAAMSKVVESYDGFYSEVVWNTIETELTFDNGLQEWWVCDPFHMEDVLKKFDSKTLIEVMPNSFSIGGTESNIIGSYCGRWDDLGNGQHSMSDGVCDRQPEEVVESFEEVYQPASVEMRTDNDGNTIYYLKDARYLTGHVIDLYLVFVK